MTQTFTYYFINQSGDGEVTNDLNTVKASVLKNKALIKIAYTGNHYLSVMTTPSDIIEHNFQLLRPNFVLWQRFYETYIEENRHHDPFIQNEYDIRLTKGIIQNIIEDSKQLVSKVKDKVIDV